jgi:hypothetical protein
MNVSVKKKDYVNTNVMKKNNKETNVVEVSVVV